TCGGRENRAVERTRIAGAAAPTGVGRKSIWRGHGRRSVAHGLWATALKKGFRTVRRASPFTSPSGSRARGRAAASSAKKGDFSSDAGRRPRELKLISKPFARGGNWSTGFQTRALAPPRLRRWRIPALPPFHGPGPARPSAGAAGRLAYSA